MKVIKVMIQDELSESIGLRAAAVSALRGLPDYTDVVMADHEGAVRVVKADTDDGREIFVTGVWK